MRKALIIVAGLIFGLILFFVIKVNQFYTKIYTPKKNANLAKKIEEKTSYNILLLGYAGGAHEGTFLTDTIILLHVDLKNKKSVLVSIPRDVWVKIPTKSSDDFHAKINTTYQMGLFPQNYPDLDPKLIKNQPKTAIASYVINQITNLPIDYFVTIDFDGFIKAIDVLGGVEINVERAFDDTRYPLAGKEKDLCGKNEEEFPELEKIATESPELAFPCRYELLHFDAGLQKMNGETALKYVRSRYSKQDGGDFGRAKRQQTLLEAVKEKVLSIGFIPKIIPLLDELSNHIETDIPLSEMQKFLAESKNASQYKAGRLVLSDDGYLETSRSSDGQFILIPKQGEDRWGPVQAWIKATIEGK